MPTTEADPAGATGTGTTGTGTTGTGTTGAGTTGAGTTRPIDTDPTDAGPPPGSERADLLEALAAHRGFLRYTLRDLSAADAARRPTVSALCLGGLVKHVTAVENRWARFIVEGPGP